MNLDELEAEYEKKQTRKAPASYPNNPPPASSLASEREGNGILDQMDEWEEWMLYAGLGAGSFRRQ
jgi:hypothetical protein